MIFADHCSSSFACMKSSASQNPNSDDGQNPSEVFDVEYLLLSLQSFDELRNDGSSGQEATASQSTNTDVPKPSCSNSYSFFSTEENSENIKNQWRQEAQETSMSASDHDRICGYQVFMTFEEDSGTSNVCNCEHEGSLVGSLAPESFTAGSSSGQSSTTESLCNCQFSEIQNNGLYDLRTSSEAFAEKAVPQTDVKWVEKILRRGDYEQKNRLISIVEDYIYLLMRDEKMEFLFRIIVDACEEDQLNSLFEGVLSKRDLFIKAVFCEQGSKSIIKLIKKIKKMRHASTVTKILASKFWDVTTHHIARTVFEKCLIHLGRKHNEILYQKAIFHYKELAVDIVGCLSLNDCVKYIAGEQRLKLLRHIADASAYLSRDPYGNYVVQKALELRDPNVTGMILFCLQGQFIELAQGKESSHVAEKCMQYSDRGLLHVVCEILMCPKAAFLLAQDQFGNYVIQTALEKTKEAGFGYLYSALANSLVPYLKELNRSPGGRKMIQLLKE